MAVTVATGNNTYGMEMSRYAKGVYYVQLRDDNGIRSAKFIKE